MPEIQATAPEDNGRPLNMVRYYEMIDMLDHVFPELLNEDDEDHDDA